MIVSRDITHRLYIEKLKDHNKQKSKTISFVSHEFRTPLSCIITMLQNLEESSLQNNKNNQDEKKQSQLIKSCMANA